MTHAHDPHPHPVDGLLAHAVVDPADLLAEAAYVRHRRRVQRAAAAVVAFVVFSALTVVVAQVGFSDTPASTGAAVPVAVRAEAVGVLVIRPGKAPERIAASAPVAGASTHEVRSSATYTLDGVVHAERISTEATISASTRASTAAASAEHVDLFDGRVELRGAALHATAASVDGRASGEATTSAATQLLVDGAPVKVTPNRQVAVPGIGTVLVDEQAVLASAPTGDAQTGPRARIVAALVHVRLTHPVAGLPAGTEVVVGRVDAGVREGKVRDLARPAAGGNPAPVPPLPASITPVAPTLQAGAPAPGDAALPRRTAAVRGSAAAATSSPGGSLQGYLFPVLGRHDYSNDYGAPRASTGIPHQGTDIFAEEGTPIVAVADGVLDRVGWNAIGGYRFWLFDQYGNSFYHAHLSAYAPLAQDGARVKRGDVIGFVGHTGDARSTPPHLHFEVHPGNGGPTNPFPILNAWQQGIAVDAGLGGGAGAAPTAPMALLGFSDIAPNSGLGDSVLDSVPDTTARPIEDENAPIDTSDSLREAITGPGTTPGR